MEMNGETNKVMTPLERKKKRLNLYYEKEEQMLSPNGIQSYGIGSRNVERYNTDLAKIQSQIRELETEIKEMEAGKKPRKAVAAVIHDW